MIENGTIAYRTKRRVDYECEDPASCKNCVKVLVFVAAAARFMLRCASRMTAGA
jgi:hypothetical protein